MGDIIIITFGSWLAWLVLGVVVLALVDTNDGYLMRSVRETVRNSFSRYLAMITLWPIVSFMYWFDFRRHMPPRKP